MQLIEGQQYLIWGQHKASYIGELVMGEAGLQHRFRRVDGFGIICVPPEGLRAEVGQLLGDR